MVRKTGLLLLALSATMTWAADIKVDTQVEHVTIYHSGALVTRTATLQLGSGVNELTFTGVSSKLIPNTIKITNREVTILNSSLIRKLTKEESDRLMDRKDALAKQLDLIDLKYGEAGFVANVEELEKMTAFYSAQVMAIKQEIREVEEKIAEARRLETIELEHENGAILKLVVSLDRPLNGPLRMQYVCGGVGWSPAYEITVGSSADKEVEVKYLAKAMSQTGEDWNDVTISLSSAFPLEGPAELPRPDKPWLLVDGTGRQVDHPLGEAKGEGGAREERIDRLEGVEYREIALPSFLGARDLAGRYSIKANSTVFTFPIQTVSLPADFKYYGFPALDPEVYLVALVTDWDTLGFVDGIADITYGGNDIGRSVVKFSESPDTLVLPIGKDNNVFMRRSEIADQKYFRNTSFGKKQRTTLAYRFELKNNNPFPVGFELVDQVPISQTKQASVDVSRTSGGYVNPETGEVSWQLHLKPGGNAVKELVFSIDMDGNYRYHHGLVKRRARTVAAPSF